MPVKRLMAIGGNEDKNGESVILKEFVRLSHGERANIVLMTIATKEVAETSSEYRKAFRRLGVSQITVFDISGREDTKSSKGFEAIENATGIFFTGGQQLDVTAVLGGTDMARLIKQRYEKGVVLAGTSAGAAMMSNSMILSGESDQSPCYGGVEIGPGMDFVVSTMIDTHFSQRGRHGRLATAVAHYPQDLGIGIDENTAMVLSDDRFEVFGAGAVIVIDAGPMTHTNLNSIEHGERLELHDLVVHVLPSGAQYDLAARRPLVAS
jgi:cyanophycinase